MSRSTIWFWMLFGICSPLIADDWPQWLGPQRDGVWRETGIVERFPENGLVRKWQTPIGAGYSGPAVLGDRVFVTDRVTADAKDPASPFERGAVPSSERVLCLDEATGKI
ncbi:MAG: pyrrolo-quinoline quinone, partial [Planctomycetaceae bacterium]|nr:pyrrolo-quinoline quinone [Planctomycetaceae bacterium]